MTNEELQRISLQFQEVVNLSDLELEAWLRTDESKAVGFKPVGSGESVGHASGRRIVRLLRRAARGSTRTTTGTCARSSATCTGTSPSARAAMSATPVGGTR